jgi:hypothetical protein
VTAAGSRTVAIAPADDAAGRVLPLEPQEEDVPDLSLERTGLLWARFRVPFPDADESWRLDGVRPRLLTQLTRHTC